jgi:hypothetical protein
MDSLTLSAEALALASGPLREKPLAERDAERARKLPDEWGELVRAFYDEEKWRKFRSPEPPDYQETYEALAVGLGPEEQARLLEQVRDGLLGDAYVQVLQAARQYVFERFPMNALDTATGTKLLVPSLSQQGQAWSIYLVLADRKRILEEMLMGTLLEAQAEAFRAVYPGLWGKLRELLDAERMDRIAKDEEYIVEWSRERVLRRFLGLPQTVALSKPGGEPAAPAGPDLAGVEIDIDFSRERPRSVDRAA